jgi:hypothetical protein
LVSQLGVQEGQARGDAGLLFKSATGRLGSGEFARITQAIPGVEELINDAPRSRGIMGVVDGLASMLAAKQDNYAIWPASQGVFQSWSLIAE